MQLRRELSGHKIFTHKSLWTEEDFEDWVAATRIAAGAWQQFNTINIPFGQGGARAAMFIISVVSVLVEMDASCA